MAQQTVVFLRWVDAHGGSGQVDWSDAVKSRPDRMATAGLLVSETKDYITVVQDCFGGKESDPAYLEPQVRCYLTIPRVNILEVHRWDVEDEDAQKL